MTDMGAAEHHADALHLIDDLPAVVGEAVSSSMQPPPSVLFLL